MCKYNCRLSLYDIRLVGDPNYYKKNKEDEINEHLPKKLLEIRKASTVGGFLISEKAEKSLQAFLKENPTIEPGNWVDDLEDRISKVRICLKDLKRFAKKDLKL